MFSFVNCDAHYERKTEVWKCLFIGMNRSWSVSFQISYYILCLAFVPDTAFFFSKESLQRSVCKIFLTNIYPPFGWLLLELLLIITFWYLSIASLINTSNMIPVLFLIFVISFPIRPFYHLSLPTVWALAFSLSQCMICCFSFIRSNFLVDNMVHVS